MKINIPVKLHNRFDFEVRDSKTGELKQRAYAENVILDSYWTRIFTPNPANTHIHVGTGSGSLDPARTSLFTFLAAKASGWVAYDGNEAEGWISLKRSAIWQENENMNTAWTEVGVAYGTNSSYLTTHAVIKDMNGNPVTINKGTTDIITVYATIYAYYPVNGFYDGALKIIFPISYAAKTQYDNSSFLDWMVGIRNGWPSSYTWLFKGDIGIEALIDGDAPPQPGCLGQVTNTITPTVAQKKITIVATRLAAANFNDICGIKGIALGQSLFNRTDIFITIPGSFYPYSTIATESVGTGDGSNLDFATDFPFVRNDASFVLYKNGTPINSEDYSVDYGIPNQKFLEYYFNVIDFDNCCAIPPGSGMTGGAVSDATAVGYAIVENPFYATYGINSVRLVYSSLYASDNADGPWDLVLNKDTNGSLNPINIDAGYTNKRYWKITRTADHACQFYDFQCNALDAKKNIHFDVDKAPAVGDVITADYRCDVIAKDANHVFDLTVEITLQEKVS